MANKKITDLNEATSVSGNDWLVIVDVANDETKKVHANQVGGNIPIQDTAPQDPEEDDLWIDTSEPAEMQEAIKNEYSESTMDTYSCNYVNDLFKIQTENISLGSITAQTGKYDQTVAITIPTGYKPIGIVGHSITGSSSASINASRLFVSNNTNIIYSVYNCASSGSSVNTTALNVEVLFIRTA